MSIECKKFSHRTARFKIVLGVTLGVAALLVLFAVFPDALGAIPWKVGSPMQSGDTYKYYLCIRGHQSTMWGREVADRDGCQNITLTFYGPFLNDGNAYWVIQAYGQHPAITDRTESAILTVRLSTLEIESPFHYRTLAEMLENTIFYTGPYDRTSLYVGSTWTSRTLPDMIVYSYSEDVYFAGYRDGLGRTNGMSFSPLSPLPLSAEMPAQGFSFRMMP